MGILLLFPRIHVQLKGLSRTKPIPHYSGPSGTLATQKQKYNNNNNNLHNEIIQDGTGRQKERQMSFRQAYKPSCLLVPDTKLATSAHAGSSVPPSCCEGQPRRPRAQPDPAPDFLHLPLFQRVLSCPSRHLPISTRCRHSRQIFLPAPASSSPRLAFRRPLYHARPRRARQTLPQGHCESGLGGVNRSQAFPPASSLSYSNHVGSRQVTQPLRCAAGGRGGRGFAGLSGSRGRGKLQ